MSTAAPSSAAPLAGRSLAVLGTGAVGSALARALVQNGARLTLWSRRPEASAALAAALGGGGQAVRELTAVAEIPAVLLCVAERAIEEVAATLAGPEPRPGAVALHTNGLLGSDCLGALAARGWACGKLHPLVALPPIAPGPARSPGSPGSPALSTRGERDPFEGVGFAVGGDPEAFVLADQLALALGGRPFELRQGASELYHAAASLLAGGVVSLFDQARELAEQAVVPEEDAEPVFGTLLESVVRNLVEGGPLAALTGAAARGAEELVERHLRVLAERSSEAALAYALFGSRALGLAAQRGSIDAAARARLQSVFDRALSDARGRVD